MTKAQTSRGEANCLLGQKLSASLEVKQPASGCRPAASRTLQAGGQRERGGRGQAGQGDSTEPSRVEWDRAAQ